jgi:taurine dioxygenase
MHAQARFQEIEVVPISPALGAEVRGVDLAAPLSEQAIAEIRRALLDHCVIFFREQTLTPRTQLAFARRFGDIHLHPFMQGLEEFPEVLPVIKTETDTRNFGGVWHTDQMFSPQPAMGTMLYALEVPPAGGDTLFANMYLAYEALSAGMQRMLADVRTYNVGDRFKRGGGKTREERYRGMRGMQVKSPGNVVTESSHPLIRTHPETGRKLLYVGSHTQRFDAMSDEESEPLLAFLSRHAVRPEFCCRFRWQPGSLALWDNRCTQHHAVDDYAGSRRVMHRITMQGDTPY